MKSAAARSTIIAFLIAMPLLSVDGCHGWQQPKPDTKHVEEVNALFNERTNAALDAMRLLKTGPDIHIQSPKGVLTSNLAVQMTLEHNYSLIASSESLAISQAAFEQAGLLPNPTLGQTSATVWPLSGQGGDVAFDILVTEPINAFFLLPRKQAIARIQRFQSGIDLASQAFGLAQQTRSQYNQLASLQRSRRLQEQIAKTYKQAVDEAQAQMRVGLVTRVDVNRAMIQFEDSVRQEQHYKTQFDGAAQQMNWLMGVQAPPLWTLPDQINDPPPAMRSLPDPERLKQLAIRYRLDLLRASYDRQLAQASVQLARLGMAPQVTLGFDAARDSFHKWTAGPQLTSLTLPIFDPGVVALWQAKYQQVQTQRTYDALEGQVSQDVDAALNALKMADEDVRFYKERIIPQEEENVRQQQLSFKLGNARFDDLLSTIREYVGVLQSYEAAIQAYQQAIVGLETAVGLTFERIAQITSGGKQFDTTLPFIEPPATLSVEMPRLLRPGSFVPSTLPANATLPGDVLDRAGAPARSPFSDQTLPSTRPTTVSSP